LKEKHTLHTNFFTHFIKDEGGASAIIVSLSLVVLLGFVALGVDSASLYRERAQLQNVSDLTAISAMALPESANARATRTMGRNGVDADALKTLKKGRFLRNPAIEPEDRFTELSAGDPKINAVSVLLNDSAQLHFARIFTEDSDVTLNREALATQTGAVSFSLDSHLVELNGASLNSALSDSFGASATIGSGDMQVLAAADIDLGTLLEALDTRLGNSSRNPAEILDATTTAGDIISALQSILPASDGSGLSSLASAASSTTFSVSSLVGGIDSDLGLTATDFLSEIEISALDVVKSLVAAQSSDQGTVLNVGIDAPGVISVSSNLSAGEPPAHSGWIALGEEGAELHRAAARLKTEIELQPDILGNLGVGIQVASVHLPLYLELAGSTARLERMACHITSENSIAANFQTAHTELHPANGTSVAALYLGTLSNNGNTTGLIDPASLGFADLLDISLEVALPLGLSLQIPGITIQARSHVAIGASQNETIDFTHREVKSGDTTKSYGSGELLSTSISDLLSGQNTELRVKPGQAGLVSGLAAPLISTLLAILPERLLTNLATPIDGVLDTVLAAAGVKLGAGELTLTGHHCEPIRLVN
jgi:uncharacterized membrane protein